MVCQMQSGHRGPFIYLRNIQNFSVFLVASAPGSHFDMDWGMTRVGSLLRQHCCIPPEEQLQWPLVAQASSLGSYGKDPKVSSGRRDAGKVGRGTRIT